MRARDPQRSRAELVSRQAPERRYRPNLTHVMDFDVSEQFGGGSVAPIPGSNVEAWGVRGRRMAKGASDGAKEPAPVLVIRGCPPAR